MKINTESLTEELTEARPNVKPNTIRQYEIQLNKLKKVFESDNWDFLSKPEDVVDKLKGNKFTRSTEWKDFRETEREFCRVE